MLPFLTKIASDQLDVIGDSVVIGEVGIAGMYNHSSRKIMLAPAFKETFAVSEKAIPCSCQAEIKESFMRWFNSEIEKTQS